jgi:hypothetical protein
VFIQRIVICLVCAISICLSTSTQSGRVSDEAAQLQVKIDLLSQDYCLKQHGSGPTLVGISLNLNATLHNVGGSPIILCKKYVAAHTPSLFSANSDGTAGQLAYSILEDTVIPYERSYYPRNINKDYVILQPRESMSAPVVTEVITSLAPGLVSPKSTLTPGNYFLQVWVYDWEGPPGALQTLRDRWRKQGYLIGQGSMSNRIQVSINPPKNLAMCKN